MTLDPAEAAPIWTPSPARVDSANLTAFMRWVSREYGASIDRFASLYEWSIHRPDEFWPAVWEFCGILSSRRWEAPVEGLDRMPGAVWFPGARLNFAENLLRWDSDSEALVFWNERGRQRSLSWAELQSRTARLAATLRAWGIRPGDRVAAFLPNLPETVIAMLAAASIGAVFSSCSPEFGLGGVLDRFGQIGPRVLFAVDGYEYAGKQHDCLERVARIARGIPSLERIVLVPYLSPEPRHPDLAGAVLFEEALAPEPAEAVYEQLPFGHPLYILYSSGTTGQPKCIVHGAGGTLIQHQKEHVLHTDVKPGDRVFYFTTCGWMMWNWLASALAAGATLILYDGSPLHPTPAILFDMAAAERITAFGASPRFLVAAEKAGLAPARTHDLPALRTILSTGSPLAPESFDYVYREVHPDVLLASISGGTDIISCFALGNPIGPVYRGELQTRGLGMKVEVYDENGHPAAHQKGELVCTMPFPSMPLGFWNDPGDEKYRQAYFERYPGAWTHGDFAELTPRGGLIIHGRSDAVLNPGGVRIGTAEIYRQVEQFDEVLESLAVAQPWQGDVRVILFVRLRAGLAMDEALETRLKQHIRTNLSPRHVPARIIAVPDLPRTLSGKLVELAVRNVIQGRPVTNADALANPEALKYFENLPELE